MIEIVGRATITENVGRRSSKGVASSKILQFIYVDCRRLAATRPEAQTAEAKAA
jgi:hypothetical protein